VGGTGSGCVRGVVACRKGSTGENVVTQRAVLRDKFHRMEITSDWRLRPEGVSDFYL